MNSTGQVNRQWSPLDFHHDPMYSIGLREIYWCPLDAWRSHWKSVDVQWFLMQAPIVGLTSCRSIVIRELERIEEASGGIVCVAYVYLRYSDPSTIRDLLESLMKQIVERHIDLAPVVEGLYVKHKREKTKPSQEDLLGALDQFIKCGKTLFIVLDALDEMRAEDRPVFLRLLASLDARLFITSRPLEILQRQLPEAQVFNIAASPSDLDLHIKDFLRHCPEVMALLEGTDFDQEITKTVHRKSGGMFLHAKLQLEALRHCISPLDVEETLANFPTDIEVIYSKTWKRILAQGPKHSSLAKLVLLWITHAYGEMTIEMLRRVIATSPETHALEPKRMVPEGLLISVCCGLVSVDEKTRLVRLMHYTTRDAILPQILKSFPFPHAIPAHVCISHLTNCGFQSFGWEGETGNEYYAFKNQLRNDTLLAYAHRSWVYHTHECRHYTPVVAAATDFVLNCTYLPLEHQFWVDFGGPLHIAAYHGLDFLIPSAATLGSPNDQTIIYKRSPLMLAGESGHFACAEALLSLPGVDVNLRDRHGWNALMHTSYSGHTTCARLLVCASGIDIDAVDDQGVTALTRATNKGHGEIVEVLLGVSGIDTNDAEKKDKQKDYLR
ncbi:hypothetical protein BKA70DRAFT_1401200 [Coprinopsis sp. MPI-PUGE-AT-0042]|nr:hypothetical protein BKA70DRAFT_1401200 [Coprinopsis sp. MPI-PUGE-AT-0042]